MDPNEVLSSIRSLLHDYNAACERRQQLLQRIEDTGESGLYAEADELHFDSLEEASGALDLFESLDEWLSNGGFLPDAWVAGRVPDVPQPQHAN